MHNKIYVNVFFFRGEHLLLFLAQTVARQTIEQRQFRPHRNAADARPKAKTKTLGTSGVTPPLPDHDLDPPRFARRALEFILQDWRAVSAMMRDGCRPPGEARYGVLTQYSLFLALICLVGTNLWNDIVTNFPLIQITFLGLDGDIDNRQHCPSSGALIHAMLLTHVMCWPVNWKLYVSPEHHFCCVLTCRLHENDKPS